MSLKKIYVLSIVIGLVIGLIVIGVTTYYSTPITKEQRVYPVAKKSRPTTFAHWIEVAPPTRLFTASFPVSPQRVEEELPISGTDYSLIQESHTATDAKGNVFRIITFVYPQPFSADQAKDVLEAALDGMVNVASDNILLQSTTATFDTLPAKIFMIQDKSGYYYQGEMFLKDRVLYQAFVTYSAGDLAEGDLQNFLDSIIPTVDAKPAV